MLYQPWTWCDNWRLLKTSDADGTPTVTNNLGFFYIVCLWMYHYCSVILLNSITRCSFTCDMSHSWLIDLHKIDLYVLSNILTKRCGFFLFSVHNAVVTTAVFAPNPQHFLAIDDCSSSRKSKDSTLTPSTANTNAEFVISADISGCIKVIRAK